MRMRLWKIWREDNGATSVKRILLTTQIATLVIIPFVFDRHHFLSDDYKSQPTHDCVYLKDIFMYCFFSSFFVTFEELKHY